MFIMHVKTSLVEPSYYFEQNDNGALLSFTYVFYILLIFVMLYATF